jgi:hypothetical protein
MSKEAFDAHVAQQKFLSEIEFTEEQEDKLMGFFASAMDQLGMTKEDFRRMRAARMAYVVPDYPAFPEKWSDFVKKGENE